MTYGNNYRLADKMQNKFRNRGSDVSGMQASSTSEIMRRAEMGRDPRVNCAEQAFRESYRTKQSQNGRSYSAQRNSSGTRRADPYADTSSRRAYSQTHGNATRTQAQTKRKQYDAAREEPITPAVEIKVKHKTVPPLLLAFIIVGTLMVMCLVLSISEIYQTTNEIAQLENQLEVLQNEADELKLRLEEKNDVRTIEEIATNELGMIKEDALQRRYVSLSDGEYIELVADGTEDESTGGVMLSSIFSSLGQFFERFK